MDQWFCIGTMTEKTMQIKNYHLPKETHVNEKINCHLMIQAHSYVYIHKHAAAHQVAQ